MEKPTSYSGHQENNDTYRSVLNTAATLLLIIGGTLGAEHLLNKYVLNKHSSKAGNAPKTQKKRRVSLEDKLSSQLNSLEKNLDRLEKTVKKAGKLSSVDYLQKQQQGAVKQSAASNAQQTVGSKQQEQEVRQRKDRQKENTQKPHNLDEAVHVGAKELSNHKENSIQEKPKYDAGNEKRVNTQNMQKLYPEIAKILKQDYASKLEKAAGDIFRYRNASKIIYSSEELKELEGSAFAIFKKAEEYLNKLVAKKRLTYEHAGRFKESLRLFHINRRGNVARFENDTTLEPRLRWEIRTRRYGAEETARGMLQNAGFTPEKEDDEFYGAVVRDLQIILNASHENRAKFWARLQFGMYEKEISDYKMAFLGRRKHLMLEKLVHALEYVESLNDEDSERARMLISNANKRHRVPYQDELEKLIAAQQQVNEHYGLLIKTLNMPESRRREAYRASAARLSPMALNILYGRLHLYDKKRDVLDVIMGDKNGNR